MDNLPLGQRCLKEGYKYITIEGLRNYFDCIDVINETESNKWLEETSKEVKMCSRSRRCNLHFEPIESFIFGIISDKYLGLIEKIKPIGVNNFYVVYPCFNIEKPLKDPIVVGVLRESEVKKYYEDWIMINIDKNKN